MNQIIDTVTHSQRDPALAMPPFAEMVVRVPTHRQRSKHVAAETQLQPQPSASDLLLYIPRDVYHMPQSIRLQLQQRAQLVCRPARSHLAEMQRQTQPRGLCADERWAQDRHVAARWVAAEVDADDAACLVRQSEIDDFFCLRQGMPSIDREDQAAVHSRRGLVVLRHDVQHRGDVVCFCDVR